jgi:heme-degrading monooxygenase HmoA
VLKHWLLRFINIVICLGAPMSVIANTPKPPYFAVIFTSTRTEGDNGYGKMADRMVELAEQQPGFLGIESAKEDVGITVSYWADLDSIKNWKANSEHLEAQKTGRKSWYDSFKVRISKVERDYGI